jgi:hypothetical protein
MKGLEQVGRYPIPVPRLENVLHPWAFFPIMKHKATKNPTFIDHLQSARVGGILHLLLKSGRDLTPPFVCGYPS